MPAGYEKDVGVGAEGVKTKLENNATQCGTAFCLVLLVATRFGVPISDFQLFKSDGLLKGLLADTAHLGPGFPVILD